MNPYPATRRQLRDDLAYARRRTLARIGLVTLGVLGAVLIAAWVVGATLVFA